MTELQNEVKGTLSLPARVEQIPNRHFRMVATKAESTC